MEYNNLIQEFLDGKLDKEKENQLFYALSSDDSLRSELRESALIDRSFYRKLSSFTPSAAATTGLFSKMGFSAADSITPAAAPAKAPPNKGFFGRNSGAIASSFASAVATALIFLLFLLPDGDSPGGSMAGSPDLENPGNLENPSIAIENENNAGDALRDAALNKNSGNVESDNKSGDSPGDEKIKEVVKIKYVYLPAKNEAAKEQNPEITPLDNTELKERAIEEPDDTQAEETPSKPSKDIIRQAKDSTDNKIQLAIDEEPESAEENGIADLHTGKSEFFRNISIELKGAQFTTTSKAHDILTTTPDFLNFGFGLSYSLNDRFILVFEAQQEKFYQEFRITDDYGNTYDIKQYPDYYNIQGGLRYKFANYGIYDIFAQGLVGGTQTGATGSIMLGAEIKPASMYSFILSLEASSLAFMLGNEMQFSAPKFGFNYGIAINF